jgi:hypothetical protein
LEGNDGNRFPVDEKEEESSAESAMMLASEAIRTWREGGHRFWRGRLR